MLDLTATNYFGLRGRWITDEMLHITEGISDALATSTQRTEFSEASWNNHLDTYNTLIQRK